MIRSVIFGRGGKVPRSALFLVLLLIGAAAALFFASGREPSSNLVLGGPLLDLENKTIEGFLLTRDGAQYRFDRNDVGYWTLRGAASDFLDQAGVSSFLVELEKATGGRLLPGTEVEDRRYEFNGSQAIRLTVFTSDGQRQTLALGVANPVTGYYYASGCGRLGCFPVTEVFQHGLASLPASLQLATLLPHFDRSKINRVELWYRDQLHLLSRLRGRWWLSQPDNGVAALGNLTARAYHRQYDDRRMEFDGRTWLLASHSAVAQVIYQSSDIVIKDYPASRLGQGRLSEWELDPPWRKVRLFGAGINPDSTEADPNMLEVAFGPALEGLNVPVLRRGNVLMTEIEALISLNAPLGDFLDVGAISFLVAQGDSIRIFREGKLLLNGARGAAPVVLAGAHERPAVESWHTTHPSRSQRSDMKEVSYQGLVRNLIVNLDRLEILNIWPEVHDGRILSDRERVVVEVDFGRKTDVSGAERGTQRLEFGFLVEEHLPAGAQPPVLTSDGIAPVALWNPGTGKLLQVPNQVVVTMRNHFTDWGKE